ncbi:Protein ZGRF1 [Camellia lanceoleosa]|uniref:Protein ZGRF1 n=1 Tax=Camellia lanceoleosa TaxID=1840588 RepID=A0ACC0GRS0_9ERIC|nr:Protein ZGRF1 [Camellia lanceoleosa]
MLSCRLVYPAKMSSSSIGSGEGQMLRFMSNKCHCGRKAAIRIVESEKPSKGRLYYVCENASFGDCDFWAWCNPIGYDPIYGRDEIDDEKPRVEKGV